MALAEPADGEVAFSSFNRTPKARSVSVRGMREYLRGRVSAYILGAHGSPMADFIRERLASEGDYAAYAARRRQKRGR